MFPDLDRGIVEDVVRAKQGRWVSDETIRHNC